MRSITLALAASILLAGLAAPTASADDNCPVPDVALNSWTGLFFRDDCSPDPHLDTSGSCLGGGGTTKTLVARENLTIAITICDGNPGNPGGLPPIGAAPGCGPREYHLRPIAGQGETTIHIAHNCQTTVDVNENPNCLVQGPMTHTTTYYPVTVSVTYCANIVIPPLPATNTGGPCDRLQRTIIWSNEVIWTLDDRCRHDIWLDPAPCPNEAQWTKTQEQEEVHPNLTIHYTQCRLG